jgi:hypothetical protein
MADPPTRIPYINGDEQDVLTSSRRFFVYTKRPGVCRRVKRGYQRRLRQITRAILRSEDHLSIVHCVIPTPISDDTIRSH